MFPVIVPIFSKIVIVEPALLVIFPTIFPEFVKSAIVEPLTLVIFPLIVPALSIVPFVALKSRFPAPLFPIVRV